MTATAIKERPILFSAPMVRAILDGSKTQTRRAIKGVTRSIGAWTDDVEPGDRVVFNGTPTVLRESRGRNKRDAGDLTPCDIRCPYGNPGDRLYVQETFYYDMMPFADGGPIKHVKPEDIARDAVYYRADGECCQQIPECACAEVGKPRWRPSMNMPKAFSRILLEVTDVRVERVQGISEADALAEGCDPFRWQKAGGSETFDSARECFESLWDSIAKPGEQWADNPWVWAVNFKRGGES